MQLETLKKLIKSNRPTSSQPASDTLVVYKDIPKVTIDDAVEFIRANNELPLWSDDEIKVEISRASRQAALTFTTDDNGKLCGICFGEWQENATVFFCHCIIAPKQYRTYVEYLKSYFPQCKEIRGIRGKNLTKVYNVKS